MNAKLNLITLNHLEFFCQQNQLMVKGRTRGGQELWVSPLGAHSGDLSYEQIDDALGGISTFELRELLSRDDSSRVSYFVSRNELERELDHLIH
ncbi:MAG TPA: hypothetical protein VLV83_17500 [Acidobacteriota bacterium]|nr:hypothetical protein [Acidobacteriota bacterium]